MVRGRDITGIWRIWLLCLLVLFTGMSCTGTDRLVADCDINRGVCLKRIGDVEVVLDITPRPVSSMKELTFFLKLKGVEVDVLPKRVLLELTMPGMEMGKNQVILESKGKGIYKGRGTIVRCPSGKRLWRAGIWLPGVGEASFLFNVDR